MWKGSVERTERVGKTLRIIITYTNGDNSFSETIGIETPQSDTWLSEQIKQRLDELNAMDEFESKIKQDQVITSKNISSVELDQIIQIKNPKIKNNDLLENI